MVSGLYAPRSTVFDELPIEHRAALASAVLIALGGRGKCFPIACASEDRRGGSERRGGDRRDGRDRREERRARIERRHDDDRRDIERFSYNPHGERRGTERPDESKRRGPDERRHDDDRRDDS